MTFSGGIVDGISGVQIGPGATLLARIPLSPTISARLAEKFAIAAFVAAYGASFGLGISEFTEELPMIGILGELPAPLIVKNGLKSTKDGFPIDDPTKDEQLVNPQTFYWDDPSAHA